MRPGRTHRLIDPVQDAELHMQRRHGVKSQAELVREIEQARRAGDTERVLLTDTLTWYRANIGASGDAAYQLRIGTPSSDSAWAMTNLPLAMPAAFRIVGGAMWSSEARTGGTATLRIRVTESGTSTDYDFADVVLNATTTQTVSRVWWSSAPRGASGATLEARIVTAGTWAPTTADMGVRVIVAYDLT